jgi:HAD superfamily hydrolase (TIGR01549 family)
VTPDRSRIDAVLFDWDGTLVDSAEATFRCYESTFGSYGIRFDRDTYAATYSPNWHRTYTAVGLPADRWDEADARWVEGYCRLEIPLLPGAREAIERLAAAGLAQAIVTSGERKRVLGELERHDLARYFPVLVAGSDGMARKPHPEALLAALSRMDVPPGRAVYVGDSPEDIEMARNAGTWSIGIPGAFPNTAALQRSQPDLLAASLADAADALLGDGRSGDGRRGGAG